jgi:photosystem II stability/assembly factor-like uncharacterized protein
MKTARILLLWICWLNAVGLTVAQTWTQTSAPVTNWICSASSIEGDKLVAVATAGFGLSPGPIYTSTNSGLTWQCTAATNESWASVTSSSDGSKLAAVTQYGGIYTSTNAGETWNQATNAPNTFWSSIASSADCNQ